MLSSLTVYSPRVFTTPFPDNINTDPSDAEVRILNIDGLGPVPASITSAAYGGLDGEAFSGANTGKRNIVLTLHTKAIVGNWQVSEIRGRLYSYFMPQNEVRLVFQAGGMGDVEITGYVESFEPTLFGSEDEIQVSIICPDPYFQSVSTSVLVGNGRVTGETTYATINYPGTVPTGFLLEIQKSWTTTSSVGIMIQTSQIEIQQMELVPLINDTYDLHINSVAGNKYVRRVTKSDGTTTNRFGDLDLPTEWPILYPGENRFVLETGFAGYTWTIRYKARYGGL